MNMRIPPKGKIPPPLEEMFRYQQVFPFFALTKTFNTRQFQVTTTPQLAIETLRPKVYAIANADTSNPIFFGNKGMTMTSGFPLLAEEVRIFGMAENTELWVVAGSNLTLYILEMGV